MVDKVIVLVTNKQYMKTIPVLLMASAMMLAETDADSAKPRSGVVKAFSVAKDVAGTPFGVMSATAYGGTKVVWVTGKFVVPRVFAMGKAVVKPGRGKSKEAKAPVTPHSSATD